MSSDSTPYRESLRPSWLAGRTLPGWLQALRARPELLAVVGIAGILNLWGLSINGWANTYYSAAVRSMTTSWHDFLFASLDKIGPHDGGQAAAQPVGAGAVGAGLRLSPAQHPHPAGADGRGRRRARLRPRRGGASVVPPGSWPGSPWPRRRSRSPCRATTTPTSCWSCAAWPRCGSRCARWRTGGRSGCCGAASASGSGSRPRWPWRCSWCRGSRSPTCGWRRADASPRFASCWPAGSRSAVVGLAWPLLVTLTPAADRPWISGTADNSVWSLIFNYNGVGRVTGQTGAPGAGFGGGGGGGAFGGATGVFRLLQSGLGDQAGWLLGFAVVAGLGVLGDVAPAAQRSAHRLADRCRGRVPGQRGGVQLRVGDLPPLLRLVPGAVHGRADRRRGRRGALRRPRGARCHPGGDRRRGGHRARGARQPLGRAVVGQAAGHRGRWRLRGAAGAAAVVTAARRGDCGGSGGAAGRPGHLGR